MANSSALGLAGERSGLWTEYARLIRELRPRYVIVENVAMLLGRGLGAVLGDLAALGYDAEWHCIPACYVGARHIRDRVWIVAYPAGVGREAKPDIATEFLERGRESQSPWGADGFVPGCRACENWTPPDTGFDGLAYGLPEWMGSLTGYGNAVVPQIPEIIGRAIMQAEGLAA